MNPAALQTACQAVYRRFPELRGCRPIVKAQAGPAPAPLFQLTFRGQARTIDQKALPRLVRVTANAQGKIIKWLTSH